MNVNIIFNILLLMLLVSVFIHQILCIFRIEIREKRKKSIWITYWIGTVFFLIFSLYFGQNAIHYVMGIVVALIFLMVPFTTGLSKNNIIYESHLTGLSGIVPKQDTYPNVKDFSIQHKHNNLLLEVVFQNTVKVNMTFDKTMEEKIREKFY